jgi:hypothetical protein
MAVPNPPVDPQPNKASDEGVVALAGAVTTILVYAVSNYRRLFR